ncbi:hypothetical protein [uncultured Clostridium sp.]
MKINKNFIILIAICKGIQWCKGFVNRNKETDEKLESKDSNNI